eukprot:13629644-Alexandrium_andersonii.AAC.1
MHPANALRNVASDAVRAALVFLLDVDFVLSWCLRRFIVPAGPWAGAAGGTKLLQAPGGSEGQ